MTTSARTPRHSALSAASSTPAAGTPMTARVDLVGDLLHRAVGPHAGDRRAVAVDGVRGSVELRFEDVAEELAAHRATAARGTDDRDRARLEEGPQRRAHGDVVA